MFCNSDFRRMSLHTQILCLVVNLLISFDVSENLVPGTWEIQFVILLQLLGQMNENLEESFIPEIYFSLMKANWRSLLGYPRGWDCKWLFQGVNGTLSFSGPHQP